MLSLVLVFICFVCGTPHHTVRSFPATGLGLRAHSPDPRTRNSWITPRAQVALVISAEPYHAPSAVGIAEALPWGAGALRAITSGPGVWMMSRHMTSSGLRYCGIVPDDVPRRRCHEGAVEARGGGAADDVRLIRHSVTRAGQARTSGDNLHRVRVLHHTFVAEFFTFLGPGGCRALRSCRLPHAARRVRARGGPAKRPAGRSGALTGRLRAPTTA